MKILRVYAITKENKNNKSFGSRLKEIRIEKDSLNKLENDVEVMFSYFSKYNQEHNFQDEFGYKIDNDNIFYLKEDYFSDVNDIFGNDANTEPLNIDKNDIKLDYIKGFSFFVKKENKNYVLFQKFRKNYLFKKNNCLMFMLGRNTDEYHAFNKSIISFPDFIIGYYDCYNNKFYFRYEHLFRGIINLSKYYKEAKEEEIRDLFLSKDGMFIANDYNNIIINTTEYEKRKISAIISNMSFLKDVDINIIKSQAFNLNIDMQFDDNNKIILPENDKELLKRYIKFFNGDIYKHPFLNKIFESNSKKEIK